MKKMIALILALVLCFGLVACCNSDIAPNGPTNKQDDVAQEYVGTWKGSDYMGGSMDDGECVEYYRVITLLLKEDGTGTYTDAYSSSQNEPMTAELEWSYDQTNHTIDVFFPKQNRTFAFEIKENDGKTYLQQGSYMSLYRE